MSSDKHIYYVMKRRIVYIYIQNVTLHILENHV